MNIQFSKYDNERGVDLPGINEKLAEFLGILFGDGYFLNKRNKYTIGIALNLSEDSLYFEYVASLIKELFNINPTVQKRKAQNRLDLIINSKAVFWYLRMLGFPIGVKKNRLTTPNWIIKNKDFIKSFLRGIFDTDGSLFFAKRGTYKLNEYPVIEIKMCDSKFIDQLSKLLSLLGFKSVKRKYKIQLNGRELTEKWINEIGIRNFNSISRYLVWKKFKYCPPKTTLKQRLKMLGWQKVDRLKSGNAHQIEQIRLQSERLRVQIAPRASLLERR